MDGPPAPDKVDGNSHSSGSKGGSKKRSGGVSSSASRELPSPLDVVRADHGRDREHPPPPPDQTVRISSSEKHKKKTLHDFRQTKDSAGSIAKLNDKKVTSAVPASEWAYSPPRKSRHSISPSPSPPPGEGSNNIDEAALEANFGFYEPGGFVSRTRNKTDASARMAILTSNPFSQSALSFSKQDFEKQGSQVGLQPTAQDLLNQAGIKQPSQVQLAAQVQQTAQDELDAQGQRAAQAQRAARAQQAAQAQQAARDMLNQQRMANFNSNMDGAANNSVPRSNVVHGIPQQDLIAGMPRTDILTMIMMDMNSKYSDIQMRQAEMLANFAKIQQSSLPSQAIKPPDNVVQDHDEDSEGDFGSTSWSGQPPSSKQGSISLSESGVEFWSELIAIDEQGKKDLRFKKVPKYPNKLKFYTEGDNLSKFRCPKQNQELAVTDGWRARQEEELVSLQKYAGAAGAALCFSVDNIRGTQEDLLSAIQDFQQGKFEDPGDEAEKVFSSIIDLLEEGVISHVIDALKFVATNFGAINLRRHNATLAQGYLSSEAKRVLEQSPPDEEFLFGGQVKDSVQKIRDTSLIKEVFNKKPYIKKPFNNNKKAFNKSYGGDKKFFKKNTYRPADQRFKKGRRKPYDDFKKEKKSDKKQNADD